MRKNKQELSLIAAYDQYRVIGVGGQLPWRLSSDLVNFKKLTLNNTVIMGRRTFESIGRALPQRQNIVISKTLKKTISNIAIARSVEEALLISDAKKKCFFIGGAEIYRLFLPEVKRIYLTEIHTSLEGDTEFPELDSSQWFETMRKRHQAGPKDDYDFSFVVLDRV